MLTTMAFDHSRRRWFGTCSCKPVPRGLPSSVEQLHTSRPLRPSLRSWRTVARETGLHFQYFTGATGDYYLPEITGAGVAVFDYDNDGDLDV